MKIIEEKPKRNYTFFLKKKKDLELYYLKKKKKFSHSWLRITLTVWRKWANAPFKKKKKNLAYYSLSQNY